MDRQARKFYHQLTIELADYAGYVAWMATGYEPYKGSARTTRLARYEDAAWWPECPDEGMVRLFNESGKFSRGFESLSPLTWGELKAFNEANSLDLTCWEYRCLMTMSRSYCNWASMASDPDCDPPIIPDDKEVLKAIQERNMQLMKAQMSQAKKPR